MRRWVFTARRSRCKRRLAITTLPSLVRKTPTHSKRCKTWRYSYDTAGRQGEALKLREQVLPLYRKVLGPEHPDTIGAMNALAYSYQKADRQDEALKLREQVLPLRRKVLGPEHPDTLSAMHNLANSYFYTAHWDEALKLREQVLALRRKVNGPEHPDTVMAMSNLADSYDEAGRRDELVKLREQVLPLYRKVLGPEHPTTIDAMTMLANAYDEAGRRDEALSLREQALSLRRKVLGPEHPDTLWSVNNLAESYFEAGRNREAIALLEESCRVNPKDSLASLRLATWQTWFGRDTDYEATRRRLLQQADGTDQASTACRAAQAYCIRSSTDATLLAKALNLAQQAVELAKGNPSPWGQLSLGLAEYRNAQYAAAEGDLTAADQTAGGDGKHEIQGTARLFRAMSLFQQHKTEEARKLFILAEVQMPPFPTDVSKPLADGRSVSHDVVILWLAYKEAKTLIWGPSAAVAVPWAPKEAIAALEQACESDPQDTEASLKLATWQTWFGQDADYEATRRRLVQQAEGTDQAPTASRAAKAYCIRPSTDATLLAKALNLAQRALELAEGNPSPWYQLSLGLAEYRTGQAAAAERTLTVAEQTAGKYHDIVGTARLFRAMSLFRQERPEEARKLFSQAEAEMPPFPADERKPFVDGRLANHDVLICWLAYKEAKTLIGAPSAPVAGPSAPK